MAKLAIQGNERRPNQVSSILTALGGINTQGHCFKADDLFYFIDNDGTILTSYKKDGLAVYDVDEFMSFYPYKLGDMVVIKGLPNHFKTVVKMRWDEQAKTVQYAFDENEECTWFPSDALLYASEIYKVGDQLYVKSLEWYNSNKDVHGDVIFDGLGSNLCFIYPMFRYCGTVVTISEVISYGDEAGAYRIKEDAGEFLWTNNMLEKIKDEPQDFVLKKTDVPEKVEVEIPEGYEYVIEDGKLFFQKKKYEYPKTYEECCKTIETSPNVNTVTGVLWKEIEAYQRLIICRNAYWKSSEDWEPDWDNEEQIKYKVYVSHNNIRTGTAISEQHTFVFPTKEMLEAFVDNFQGDLNKCKMFL